MLVRLAVWGSVLNVVRGITCVPGEVYIGFGQAPFL